MSGHRSFDELRARMTPERREANRRAAADMGREYILAQIRQAVGMTQTEMANRLEVSQPTYSAFERGDNLRIGTLQKIVKALGGILKLQVEIDGKEFSLRVPSAATSPTMA